MKLDELTTLNKAKAIKAIRDTSDHPYSVHIENALQYPYSERHIASGAFAAVYSGKKPNHVYKVYHDPVYHAFAKLAKEQGHIYSAFPKIHALGKTKDNLGVAKMERLKPLDNSDQELIKHLPPGIEGKQYGEWSNSHTGQRFAEKYPHLHSAISLVASKFPKVILDTHMHNVMKRPGSNEYVLTDPIAGHPDNLNEAWLEELTTLNKSTIPDKIMANLKGRPGAAIAKTLGGTKKQGKLGKGVFGVVYKSKNNPNTVTKVFRDPAYLDFARHAKDNPDDPHLPKIHSIKHDPKSGISVVRMEKLVSSDEMRQKIGFGHDDAYYKVSAVLGHKRPAPTGLEVSNNHLNPSRSSVRDLMDNHPTVHDSLTNLASALPYHQFDLHMGNVMYRPDPDNKFKHTMVFTDPVVHPDHLKAIEKKKKPIFEMMTLNKAVAGKPGGRMRGGEIADQLWDKSTKRRPFYDVHNKPKPPNHKPLIGAGEFAAVYPSTHNKVVKVADDPAYHEFAKYARANPDDPHLPKIHSVKKAGSVAVYRMEKLHSMSEPGNYHPEEEHLNDIMTYARHMPNSRVLEHKDNPDSGLHHSFERLRKANPSLHNSLVKIVQNFPQHDFDIGPSNIMVRHNQDGSKHLVFTDPIYSKEHLWEDGPTNGVAGGHIAGIGIGPDGEPPKKVNAKILRRRKKLNELTTFNLQNKPEHNGKVWYHGSPSNVIVRGSNGIHVGTYEAAHEALTQRVGVPADGKPWDGTRSLGNTLMAGRTTLQKLGRHPSAFYDLGYSGNRHNVMSSTQKWPEKDYYIKDHPDMHPLFYAENGDRKPVSLDSKPKVHAFHIVGPMHPDTMDDLEANQLAQQVIGRWKKHKDLEVPPTFYGRQYPKHYPHGIYYNNDNEDTGSVSAIVPHRSWLKPV